MAHTTGTSLRAGRLIAFAAMAVLAAATAAAFGRVFTRPGTTGTLILAGLASAAIAAVFERRSLMLATAVSAVAATVVVSVAVFPDASWHGLPTSATLGALGDAATQIGEQARVNIAPTAPVDPLLLAAVTAVWASVFSAHALAFRAGSPLLALVPPAALLAFADSVLEDVVRPLYGVVFLAAVLLVAFADGVDRIRGWGPVWGGAPGARERIYTQAWRGGRRLAAFAVVLAALAPILVPGFGSRAIIDLSTVNADDQIRLNPLVQIGAELNRSEPRDLFTVRTPIATYHRMMSLQTYNANTWIPDLREDIRVPVDGDTGVLPVPEGVGEEIELTYTLRNDPGFPWLPVAFPADRVDADQDLTFDPETSTVWLEDHLRRGDGYIVEAEVVSPTPEQLDLVEFSPQPDDPYVSVPPELATELRAIAEDWTSEEPNDYRRILAIQERLRTFAYDDDVPARDDQFTIVDFLTTTGAGYCQQFASSMATMLRTLDIPARVAVGFRPGTPVRGSAETYVVSTGDFHAWVEVRFPGFGWLAFEPTPTRSNIAAASYLEPAVPPCTQTRQTDCVPGGGGRNPESTPATNDLPNRPQLSEAEPGISSSAEPVEITPARTTLPTVVVGAIAVGALVLVVLAVPPARSIRRRRRLRRAGPDPRRRVLVAYDVFTERAGDLGFGRGPGETPMEYHDRIAGTGLLSDGHLGELTRIAARAAYGPTPPDQGDLVAARAAAATTLGDLRRATPVGRRVRGWYRRA
jgi:transglutaminase-like putative cysteine protease